MVNIKSCLQRSVSVSRGSYSGCLVAPISGDSPGLARGQVSHGVRQVQCILQCIEYRILYYIS